MLGGPEILILLAIGVLFVAVPIGIVVFVLNVNKNKTTEPVPSYNEIKVENASLRNEVIELRERLGESDN